MNIHLFTKKQTIKHKKDGRINPHRLWIAFLSFFVLALTITIIVCTYFFVISSQALDAPVAPRTDTNIGQIKKIEQSIQKTEDAVSARQTASPASQNSASIVQ